MREIKFRAWNKEKNIMCFDNEDDSKEYLDGIYMTEIGFINHRLSVPDKDNDWNFRSRYDVMQFTGLKDKNGKEIYEGDILLFNNDYPNARKVDWKCVVKYRKGSFVCEYPKDGVYNHFDSWNVPKVTWEIIGNIYENPELISS